MPIHLNKAIGFSRQSFPDSGTKLPARTVGYQVEEPDYRDGRSSLMALAGPLRVSVTKMSRMIASR